MNIRIAFAILLFVMNIASLETEMSFFFAENGKSNVSSFFLQDNSADSISLGECSNACKVSFFCTECGTACCAQSIMDSTSQLIPPTFEKIRIFSIFRVPLTPDLSELTEPPRA